MRSMPAMFLFLVIGCIEPTGEAPAPDAGMSQAKTDPTALPGAQAAPSAAPGSTTALPTQPQGVQVAPGGPQPGAGGVVRYSVVVAFTEDNSKSKQLVLDAAKLPDENVALINYVPSVQTSQFARTPAKVGAAFDFPNGQGAPNVEELKSRLEAVEGVEYVNVSVTTYQAKL